MRGTADFEPIETVPHDGTRVLLLIVHANAEFSDDPVGEGWVDICEGYWTDHNGGGLVWEGLCGRPTKWRPLGI